MHCSTVYSVQCTSAVSLEAATQVDPVRGDRHEWCTMLGKIRPEQALSMGVSSCILMADPSPSLQMNFKKSCIGETKNLSTDADCRTDTILEKLHDCSQK